MYELAAMLATLGLLVVLLRVRIRLGRAMLICSLLLALLLRVSPGDFWETVVSEWRTKNLSQTTGYLFVTLTALVLLVNVLGEAMKRTGVSQRLAPALEGLFKSRRLALLTVPMMMGMLPTPGGIMLSAPMVRELGDHIGVSRSRLAAINFLFRHQWESVWPLFPAVPLIQGMFGVAAFTLIWHNLPIMVAGVLGGIVFLLLRGIPPKKRQGRPSRTFGDNLRSFAHAFWPIVLVAALYAALNLPPAVGLLIAVCAFLYLHSVPLKNWGAIFKAGLQLDFVLLILGALLFKVNLEAGGAIPAVVEFFPRTQMPSQFLIFFLPMLVAFLTGVTMPTVAITFPLLAPYIGAAGQAKMHLETLAFSGLVCGLLTTPVHLCLALSASYFQSSLASIVVRLIGPVLCIAATGFIVAHWLG